jgi:hypothetical protein
MIWTVFFAAMALLSVLACVLLHFGVKTVLYLAIELASKLEPHPGHPDQFETYKPYAEKAARIISIGLSILTWVAGALAGSGAAFYLDK